MKPAHRDSGFTRGTHCLRCAVLGGIPAHLAVPVGESPPPVAVTPGREFPPLDSTSGRESPPILEAPRIPSAEQLGEQSTERTPSAGSTGPRRPQEGRRGGVAAAGTRRAVGTRDRASRGCGRSAVLQLPAGAAAAPAVAAAATAAAARGPAGRRLGLKKREAAGTSD